MNATTEPRDPFAEGGPLEAAWFVFEERDLDLPPLPTDLLLGLERRGETVFSSRERVRSLLDRDRLLEEALAGEAPPYLAFGFEGHGTNNHYLRYHVVLPHLALLVELPFGNAYRSEDGSRGQIASAFRSAARLLAAPPPADGTAYVIDHRGADGSRWRRRGEPDWHECEDAIAAVADRSAG